MSTHALIVVRHGKNIYKGIHCWWDGYPSHVGRILNLHFNTRKLADQLVAGGHIECFKANSKGEYTGIQKLDLQEAPDVQKYTSTGTLAELIASHRPNYTYVFTNKWQLAKPIIYYKLTDY